MAALISLSLLFALAKDVLYVGAISDILRIAALALAGLAGTVGALSALGRHGLKPYAPVLLYCLWCVVPIAYAADTNYLLYQILSLLCAVVAGIGAFGGSVASRERAFRTVANSLVWLLAAGVALSVVGLALWPARVWDYPIGDAPRFRGVMPDAPSLGVAAGLLVGVAWAVFRRAWLKWPLVALGLGALVLTGSRTPFVAMAIAGLCVIVVHRSARTVAIAGAGVALVVALAMFAGVSVDRGSVDRAVRANSLSNMSGRLDLWKYGWEIGREQPAFGSGLTMGSQALSAHEGLPAGGGERDSRAVARATFHNGYLQSYLDSGLGGALLYVLVIGAAAWRAYTAAKSRESGMVLYCILFLAVSNLGQNAIQAPSTIHGLLFWLLVGAAAALPRRVRRAETPVAAPADPPDYLPSPVR